MVSKIIKVNRLKNKEIEIKTCEGSKKTRAYAEVCLDSGVKLFITKHGIPSTKSDNCLSRYIFTCPLTGLSVSRFKLNGATQKELLAKLKNSPNLAKDIEEARKKYDRN